MVEESIVKTSEKLMNLSMEQFENLVSLDKLILVDFYSDDCNECEIQKIVLREIKEEIGNEIKIIRINYELNQSLKQLPLRRNVPSQLLYCNGVLMWCNNGIINKKHSMIYHLICCSVSNLVSNEE